MQMLLNDEDTFETFFSHNFERYALHVDDSYRSNRVAWMHMHRRFILNHDIDNLLNTSSQVSSLSIPTDLELTRYNSSTFVLETFPPGNAPHLTTLQNAFRDGFELVLHRMQMRSAAIARFADSMSAFWHVSVEASLHFCPPSPPTKHVRDPRAATLRSGDLFIVVLDGEMVASVHEAAHEFPLSSETGLNSHSILASLQNPSPRTISLDEGDVLYVPRGSAFHIEGRNSPALYLAFHVRTDEVSATMVLRSMLAAAQKRSEGPLDRFAAPQLEWSEIVDRSMSVAHDLIPPMRRFFPLSGAIIDAFEDAGKPVGQEVAVSVLQKFVVSAVNAFFDPFIEVIKDGDVAVDESLLKWAKSISRQNQQSASYRQAREMFKLCLDWFGRQTDAPSDGISQLTLDWFTAFENRRESELEERHKAFRALGIEEDALLDGDFICSEDEDFCALASNS
ncbi:unnamed protein product [Agarophyton chilense]